MIRTILAHWAIVNSANTAMSLKESIMNLRME